MAFINQDPREYDVEIDGPRGVPQEEYPELDEDEEEEEDWIEEEEAEEDAEEGFEDLDSLLTESVSLAEARKDQKKKGTRAKASSLLLIRESEAQMTWRVEGVIAHLVEETCSCGSSITRFDAWYEVHAHRRVADAHRLVRVEDHSGLPAETLLTQKAVAHCAECLRTANLSGISEWLPIFESLGEVDESEDGQMELPLEEEGEEEWVDDEELTEDELSAEEEEAEAALPTVEYIEVPPDYNLIDLLRSQR